MLLAQVRDILATVAKNLPTVANRLPSGSPLLTRSEQARIGRLVVAVPRVLYRVIKPIGPRTSLTEPQRNVYGWLHMHPNQPAKALGAALKLTEGQVGAALTVLKRVKLVGVVGKVEATVEKGRRRRSQAMIQSSPDTRLVVGLANKPLDPDVLAVIQPDIFKDSTQAEACRYVLSSVPRPLSTRTLVRALAQGGLSMSAAHAVTNLHKTLRKRADLVLTKGSGWTLGV